MATAPASRALRIIAAVLRLGLAALFAYAGAVKIWDFTANTWATPQFFQDLLNYQLGSWAIPLPGFRLTAWDTLMVVAIYLPWLEVVAAVALLWRRFRLGAAALLTGLMAVFLIGLCSAWARGLDISCGCFGRSEKGIDYPLVFTRDLLFLATLIFVLVVEWHRVRATTASAAIE